MKVIDSVKMPGFVQWCANFVKRVILAAHLQIDGKDVDTVEIVEIEDKRIYLSICGLPFIIRTWNYIPCEQDEQGMTCGEQVEYTLFLDQEYTVDGVTSLNGRPIHGGVRKIRWSNDPDRFEREVRRYNKIHGTNEQFSYYCEEEQYE